LRLLSSLLIGSIIICNGAAQAVPWDCQRGGPSAEWVLASRPPVGDLEGHLGAEIFLRLHQQGIPVSFILRSSEDPYVRLKVGSTTTTREILENILTQAKGYRFGVIAGRVVLYPEDERYDAQINITNRSDVTRGAAIYPLLRELREKSEALRRLKLPALRGYGKSIYGYKVKIGGTHTVIEHMVSLIGNDPSVALRMMPEEDGNLLYLLDWTPVVRKISARAPLTIAAGEAFSVTVTGTLADGTSISLEGEGCGVEYSAINREIVEVDDLGRGVARKKGIGIIAVDYEDQYASVKIQVQ